MKASGSSSPLDPQIRTLLEKAKQSGLPEFWQLTPNQAREEYVRRVQRLGPKDEPIHHFEDRKIPGGDHALTIRVYTPRERMIGEKLPVLIWFHGGGFVIGDLNTHDSACRRLATLGECMVIAVDYRLAPEWKFPAAVDDSMSALRWIALHGEEIGVDTERIAVGGDSAGGNLAAVCAILARNEGFPVLKHQLLIYPCVAPEPETQSHREFAEGYMLTRKTITWFFKQYLRSQKDINDFRYAPLIADDLSKLPPAFILTAGFDPLRDEGVMYAQKLISAGNDVTLVNMPGMIHGFYLMLGAIDAAGEAVAMSAHALKQAFGKADVARKT